MRQFPDVAHGVPNNVLSREAGRRNLVTRRDYFFSGQSIYWYSMEYDLLNRPTNATDSVSLVREWLYNRRSELVAATVGADSYGYAYDSIGNRLWSAANAVTNSYTANSLNQYTAISANANPVYDADGNMTSDGTLAYAYDAENRLVSVTSAMETNGAVRVINSYDHRNKRIRKTVQRLSVSYPPPPSPPVETRVWNTVETHAFVWDGNNIVLEKVAFADGTSRTFEYFWGMDKSGTEQGAGGVEGLLAFSMDGVFYIPCYDHNGNIVRYVSEIGGIVAQYIYDPYGNVVESYGSLADAFFFGFSTKYHDRETGMVGYQRRFYRPDLGRWHNRDPIEEDGGENLYVFCKNTPISKVDPLGEFECCTCTYGGNLLRHGESIGSSVIANQKCFYLSEGGVIEVLTRYSCVPRFWESVGDCFNKFCLVKERYRCKRISRGDVEPINAAYVWVFLSSEVKPCTR